MEGLKLENGSVAVWVFDFDGNILRMPTVQYYKNKLTGEIEKIPGYEVDQNPVDFQGEDAKYEFMNNDMFYSYQEGLCVAPYDNHRWFEGLFEDVKKALEENTLSPSFSSFKNTFLIKARITSILTARWNCPDNFQRCIQYLNNECLTQAEKEEQQEAIRKNYGLELSMTDRQVLQYYFREILDYTPCDNVQTMKHLGIHDSSSSMRKVGAMKWYIWEVHRKLRVVGTKFQKNIEDIITEETPLALGFSDDSLWNIVAMWEYFADNLPINHKARLFFTGKQTQYNDVKKWLWAVWTIQEKEQFGNAMLQIKIDQPKTSTV